MKKLFLAIGLMIGMIAAPVMAQTTTATQSAGSSSDVTVIAAAGTTNNPADQTVKYSGHTWTTPSVQGSYFAGANGCLVGKGGGIAGGPIGLSFSSGSNDPSCDRRNDAAAWHALGFDNIAVARMCQDLGNADAFFSATGFACPGKGGDRYKLADGTLAPEVVLYNSGLAGQDMRTFRSPTQQVPALPVKK